MKEGFENRKRREKYIQPFLAALVLAAGLSGAAADRAEAHEVVAEMSWSEGLRALEDDAKSAKSERSALCVAFQGAHGDSHWIGSDSGTEKTASINSRRIEALRPQTVFSAWKEYMNTMLQGVSKEELAKVLADNKKAIDQLRSQEGASSEDLPFDVFMRVVGEQGVIELLAERGNESVLQYIFSKEQSEHKVGRELFEKYSAADKMLSAYHADYVRVRQEYITASLSGEPSDDMKARLDEAFLKVKGRVRSVRHADMYNEPPYAGVDVPQK